ncbi:MAG: cellobiose phosphorylase, partial [Candidatus Omnitrophota bacterium]
IDKLIEDLKKKSDHLFSWLIDHEWLEEGYFNGYYDNKGRRVEGKTKMLLQSQVFALMSEGVTKAHTAHTIRAIDRLLFDKNLGGYRLNTDFGAPYLDLGRAFGFAYGDKENGAFFSHMVVMYSFALYAQGFTEKAESVLTSIYRMAIDEHAQIYPGIPEYFNNQGRGLYLYLTGSASWYTHTLFQHTLGIDFYLGDLVISPKLTGTLCKESVEAKFYFQDKEITVAYTHRNENPSALTIEKVLLQGEPIAHTHACCNISRALIARSPDQKIRIDVSLR